MVRGDGMKWRSHAQITGLVAEALDLPEDLAELMVEASVDPDTHALKTVRREHGRHRVKRMRHHHPSRSELMRLLWRARRAYLAGEDEDSVWRLGRALHYVQDAHVQTGLFYSRHDVFEREASLLTPSSSFVAEGLEASIPSPRFVKTCLGACVPMPDPRDALDHATLMSAAVAGAVLRENEDPRHLERLHRTAQLRHWFLVVPAAFAALALVAVYAFDSGSPYMVVLGPLSAAAIVLADRRYASDRDEARWNGLI
jgi:hypothetical protein